MATVASTIKDTITSLWNGTTSTSDEKPNDNHTKAAENEFDMETDGSGSAENDAGKQFSSELDKFANVNVVNLLDLCDSLRELLIGEPITMPSIIVVGDQSTGKSSVLEVLSGIELPKGKNIVTRCPIIIRIRNIQGSNAGNSNTNPNTDIDRIELYSHEHENKKKTLRNNEVENLASEIKALQNDVAGNGTSISHKPIYVHVYRRNAIDLTLIDLPGITRNPVGNQPKNIFDQIKALVMEQISQKESIILNIVPANVDIPTAECITWTREVDPNMERSIIVVTKADLIDSKTLKSNLQGVIKDWNVRLGTCVVKCRTSDELEQKMTIKQSLEAETKFFKSHGESTNDISFGISNLAKKLGNLQVVQLRKYLPKIYKQIRQRRDEQHALLKQMPVLPMPSQTNSPFEAWAYVEQRFDQMKQLFGMLYSTGSSLKHIHDGERLSSSLKRLMNEFSMAVSKTFSNPLTSSYIKTIENETKEAGGISLPNLLSDQVVQNLVFAELQNLFPIASKFINDVQALVNGFVFSIIRDQLSYYQKLQDKTIEVTSTEVAKLQQAASNHVQYILKKEEPIYTLDPTYVKHLQLLKPLSSLYVSRNDNHGETKDQFKRMLDTLGYCDAKASIEVSSNEMTRELQITCLIYFKLLCSRFVENVAREAITSLVQPFIDVNGMFTTIRKQLENRIGTQVTKYLKEDSEIVMKRNTIVTSITRLESALSCVDKMCV